MYHAILFLPLIGALTAGLFGRFIGARASEIITTGLLIITALIACRIFADTMLFGVETRITLFAWIHSGALAVDWGLRIDALTAVMLVVVTGVSSLVHVYAIGYMHNDPSRPRFFAYLSFFTFAMLALVTADDFVQLFFGWEGVGLASYLLIGFWHRKHTANAAAIKAFVVNRVGDFGFLLGIAAVFFAVGSLEFDSVFAAAPALAAGQFDAFGLTLPMLTTICLLLFMGAMGKSAQFLLHTWLPDAMEGPTPVSALIHAATMVTAGVFLVARMSPLFELSATASAVVVVVGAITAFFAATVALTQNDIKRVIAYSTCSQLGYMFVALGVGAYQVAIFHLFTHAFFKALLFLGAGSVIHAMDDEQDMRKMGGLRQFMPASWLMMFIGTLALTGFPLTAGFFSKDAIIEAAFMTHFFAFALLLITAFLTSFYSWRLMFLTFYGYPRASNDVIGHVHESPPVMLVPMAVLALGALAAGFANGLFIGDGAAGFWGDAIFTAPDNDLLAVLAEPGNIVVTFAAPFTAMATGFILAWVFYIRAPHWPARIAAQQDLLYAFLREKWYFDALYDFLFVRPVARLGHFFWKHGDGTLIDGFGPDGIAASVLRTTRNVVKLQTGYVYHYAFVMLLGVVAFVSWFMMGGAS